MYMSYWVHSQMPLWTIDSETELIDCRVDALHSFLGEAVLLSQESQSVPILTA